VFNESNRPPDVRRCDEITDQASLYDLKRRIGDRSAADLKNEVVKARTVKLYESVPRAVGASELGNYLVNGSLRYGARSLSLKSRA